MSEIKKEEIYHLTMDKSFGIVKNAPDCTVFGVSIRLDALA